MPQKHGREGVLSYISRAAPKKFVFCAVLVWNRVGFSRELRECMNVFIVSGEYWHSNVSYDDQV